MVCVRACVCLCLGISPDHETMLAHNATSELHVVPLERMRCFSVGQADDPAAAGSPFAEDPLLYQTLVPEDEATRRGSARSGPPLSEDVILRVGREPTSRYADAVLIDPL